MQDATNTAICPLCRHPVGSDRRCLNSRCGETLDTGNWALSAAYGTEGLLPPDVPDGPWRLPELSARTTDAARIVSPLPLSLRPENGVHDIGASIECHVRLAGLATDRAVSLHFHRPTQTWWAFDWCRDSGATINGERFRNRRLKDNDILGVAGAKLRYRSGVLSAEYGTTDGVDISISGLTDARQSRSDPPRPLLDRISFVIPDGEFVGIIGPSGCGKSTLLKTLAGLVRPASGDILFNGVSRESSASAIRACTAYLPQNVDATLHDELTLAEEMASYSAIHRASRDTARETELLKELKLLPDSRVGDLSGGERRRAAFLLALLRDPAVLFLDEPAAGLDRASETDLMEHLRQQAHSGARKTILCSTHELANIRLFDRVLVMAAGALAYNGSPEDLFSSLRIPGSGDERFKLLYEHLDQPSAHEAVLDGIRRNQAAPVAPPLATSLPHPVRPPSWFGTVFGYLGRFRDSFLSFVRSGEGATRDRTFLSRTVALLKWTRRWIFNPPLVLFVWQPLLVAFCISIALKSSFTDNLLERKTIFFCAAIASFWLGMGGSVRSLVATRVNRSLERLEGVRRSAYLAAVSLATLAKGAAQGIVLTAFLILLPSWIGCEVPLESVPSTVFSLAGCLVAVEWMGGFVGLALSALSATEAFAVAMVPNLAVFALFFSQPLMDFKEDDASLGARFARVLPAHYAHLAMRDRESLDNPLVVVDEKNTRKNLDDENGSLAKSTFSWICLCILLSLAAQTIHEKNWKG